MVDFRVEFITSQYGYNPIVYNFNTGLVGIEYSAQKVAMNNNYDQEPDRVEIEIMLDDWLKTNLVNASAVYNSISSLDVKVYRDDLLDFRGVVLLDGLGFKHPNKVLKFKAYSYSYLLSLEKDASYFPANRSLDLIMSGISQKVATRYNRTSNFMDKDIIYNVTEKTDYPIYEIDSFYETSCLERTSDIGFDSYTLAFHNDAIIIRFRRIDWVINQYDDSYSLNMMSFVAEISNKVCIDMDIQSSKIGDYNSLDSARNAIESAKEDYPEHYESTSWIGRREYSFLEIYGTSYKIASNNRTITITGRVFPTSLILKTDDRKYLTALKCFLVIHNFTIINRDNDGLLRIVRNHWGNDGHGDLTSDVTSCEEIRNFKQIVPNFSCLDALYNSAGPLKELLTNYYTSIANNAIKYKLLIDNIAKNNLLLFDKITVKDEQLFITELKKDYKKDEYEIVAWRVNV
jgi:hypothetical protein